MAASTKGTCRPSWSWEAVGSGNVKCCSVAGREIFKVGVYAYLALHRAQKRRKMLFIFRSGKKLLHMEVGWLFSWSEMEEGVDLSCSGSPVLVLEMCPVC